MKKLLLDSGGLLLALQPLGCDEDDDEDNPAECGRLLSDLFSPPYSGPTSQVHSLYFSLLTGCLSTLTGSIKAELDKKHVNPVVTQSVSKSGGALPPPSKRPRLANACHYSLSDFDLLLLLDDGSQLPANREAVAGEEGADGVGSEYFRALLRGGFGEAQGDAGEAIRIKDVSAGMLLPVLHYLHGCRLTKDMGITSEREEGDRGGQCHILDSLVLEGSSIYRKGTEEPRTEDVAFQKSPLGEMMIGACRFLVTELQRELEGLCVSLLLSHSTKVAGRAAPPPTENNAEKATTKMDQECLESAEESLANRTSELELSGFEMQTENLPGRTKKPNSSPQQPHGKKTPFAGTVQKANRGTALEQKTVKSVKSSFAAEELRLRPKNPVKGSTQVQKPTTEDSFSSSEAGPGGGALATLLPQMYWFSQRYSYPALGQACLSLLLGCRDCPRPFLSSVAGDCLRRLAREADCAETLKQDLLSLATVALS